MLTRLSLCGALLAAIIVLTSCEKPVAPKTGGELSLSVVSGDQQQGAAGQELPNPLVVKVTKSDGGPVRGQILNFRVVEGGGSVFAGAALTDERGIAQERWTLGSSGAQKVEVRAVSNSTGEPQVFATFTAAIVCHDCWSTKASLNTGREYPASATINGKIYVTGGRGSSGSVLSVEAYDHSNNSWSIVGDAMQSGTYGASAAELNGQLYVVGGGLPTLDSFDPVNGHWTHHTPPPTPRSFAGAAAINGIFYFVGGFAAGLYSNALEAYDPATDTWTSKTPMPTARRLLSVAAVGGILYAVGGENVQGDNPTRPVPAVEAYDPATDSWTTKAPLPAMRTRAVAGVVEGKIYVAAGWEGDFEATTSLAYDPVTDSWSTKSAVPTGRAYATGSVLDGLFFVIGGNGGQSTVEAYKP